MNYNPLTKSGTVAKGFRHYQAPLNLFDRIVGRKEQMGILDYALGMVPFLIKFGMHATRDKSKVAHASFALLSFPFSITKLGLYIGLAPLTFTYWGTHKLLKKKSLDYKISAYTADLNNLMVFAPGSAESVPLWQIKKFHDGHLRKFSIKTNNHGELVIVRFPRGKLLATIEKSRDNIATLQKMHDSSNQNRFEYFLTHAGRNIIDFDAHALITQISKQQAGDRVKLLYRYLVQGSVDNADNYSASLAIIPKDVRDIIAMETIAAESAETHRKRGFFASFKPEEREEALLAFISKPRHQRM